MQFFRRSCNVNRFKKEARTCQKSFGDLQRDALVKIGVNFLAFTISSTEDPKGEMQSVTEGRRRKDEMVGLESTNGQA
jgi:hypothetical protein